MPDELVFVNGIGGQSENAAPSFVAFLKFPAFLVWRPLRRHSGLLAAPPSIDSARSTERQLYIQ